MYRLFPDPAMNSDQYFSLAKVAIILFKSSKNCSSECQLLFRRWNSPKPTTDWSSPWLEMKAHILAFRGFRHGAAIRQCADTTLTSRRRHRGGATQQLHERGCVRECVCPVSLSAIWLVGACCSLGAVEGHIRRCGGRGGTEG